MYCNAQISLMQKQKTTKTKNERFDPCGKLNLS
jgi:hypothetical protein